MSRMIGDDIKAVLFDHDDTLVATIEAKWAQHKHVAKKFYNKELLDNEIRQHWGKPLSQLVRLLYGTDDYEHALNVLMKDDLRAHFPKRLFETTLGVLERIRDTGQLVGVITATNRVSFNYDLKSLGIPQALFDYTQTEDDTSFHKPSPRVFDPAKEWLTEHGINPNEVVYVADGLHDMKAALGAGFQFIGVATGLISQAEFKKAGVKSIKDLPELLEV